MLTITSTQIKQQIHLLDRVNEEELLLTKRDKPFAVIISIDRYNELIGENKKIQIDKKLKALELLGSYELGGNSYGQIKAELSDA